VKREAAGMKEGYSKKAKTPGSSSILLKIKPF
jgi:hypothetical protein